jgi:hypothetical protein
MFSMNFRFSKLLVQYDIKLYTFFLSKVRFRFLVYRVQGTICGHNWTTFSGIEENRNIKLLDFYPNNLIFLEMLVQ